MRSWRETISLAIRELVFGAEDGLVSIFGLVFGVGAAADSSFVVLLAGVAGAFSGAVSMGAGVYLSVKSERHVAERELEEEREQIRRDPQGEREEVAAFLRSHGFTAEEMERFLEAARTKPRFLLEAMAAHELSLGKTHQEQPLKRALWMFSAYVLASTFPVVPYAMLPLDTARLVSLVATVAALVGVGLGRARFSREGRLTTLVETLTVATLAAGAGFAAGLLVSSLAHVDVPRGA